ncbi:MAG: FAD-dependent oxidoreductase [bacterium]
MINNKKNRIIVIGGNAAGPAAAAKAKRVDKNSEVLLFEASPYISTGTCELPYLLNNTIDDYKKIIFYDDKSFFEDKGVKVFTNTLVDNVNRRNKKILVTDLITNNSQIYDYDKLVLTTGSYIKPISGLNNRIKNFSTFKTVSDYLKIKELFETEKIKNITIIGAGYTGLEVADTLNELGFDITLIDKNESPVFFADDEIKELILNQLAKKSIQFIGNADNLDFIIKDNMVKFVKIFGRAFNTDLVIQTTGVLPNNYLAAGSQLELGESGAIKVDQKLKTSDYNIYAAGDNIEVMNFISKRKDYIPLASLASKYGHIAGSNAAGGNEYISPVIKNVTFKFADFVYSFVGLSSKECKNLNINVKRTIANGNSLIKVMPNNKPVFGKIIRNTNNGTIVGAAFRGGNEVSSYADIISVFILNNIKASNLGEINFNYSPPVSPFINILSVLGQKIKKEI